MAAARALRRIDREDTLVVHVNIVLNRKGGRKRIVVPSEAFAATKKEGGRAANNNALVGCLARAFRWRRLIETGICPTAAELASVEHVTESYLSRLLQLTLLAPNIVEGILDGRHAHLTVRALGPPIPPIWDEQRAYLSGSGRLRHKWIALDRRRGGCG